MSFDYDPFWRFDPEVADALRDAFQNEVDRRVRPSQEAAEDQAFAEAERQFAATYPDYAENRREILNFAVANGIDDLERAYWDYDLARQEAWMRQEYPEWDQVRVQVFENVLKNKTDIETAYHDLSESSAMDARAQHRATRLQELTNKFSPADQMEREAIRRDEMADSEAKFERTLKQKHREETRLASIDNSFRQATILNDRKAERARAGKVDVDAPPYLDREALDRDVIAAVERANDVDDMNDRADSTGIGGGLGSHPEIGL